MKNAIILAAGRGTRFGSNKPKGFIEVNGKTLIGKSVRSLAWFGVENILIVTGFEKEYYENFAKEYSTKWCNIKCKFNPDYKDTGSGVSLLTGLSEIRSATLILESDILYDSRILWEVKKNRTILSENKHIGDEVFAKIRGKRIVSISKTDPSYLVWVGITKLKKQKVLEILEQKWDPNLEYEYILINSGLKWLQTNYDWCEIDDKNQYEIAKKLKI